MSVLNLMILDVADNKNDFAFPIYRIFLYMCNSSISYGFKSPKKSLETKCHQFAAMNKRNHELYQLPHHKI